MILCNRHSTLFWQSCKTCNGLVATKSAQGPSCPRTRTVRSVWRAPRGDQLPRHHSMCTICNDLHDFSCVCFPNHTERSVWRASALGSVDSLGHPVGCLGRPSRPRFPDMPRLMASCGAEVVLRCLAALASADLRTSIFRGRARRAHEVA